MRLMFGLFDWQAAVIHSSAQAQTGLKQQNA